nr:UvrD-helicase domain-containing protein [Methylocapsa sp. RX1]
MIDLLAIERGAVTAPAGCGKTHLIAQSLIRHVDPKPILILTHTNAGVAALRGRLDKAGVAGKAYRLSTIDGWSMRLIGLFPHRSDIDPDILKLENPSRDYPAIRQGAWRLLEGGHIQDVLSANFSRLIIDEYQDCSDAQHAIVCYAATALPTCVLGDPLQAIFGFGGSELADWHGDVCKYFPVAGELDIPWRWKNAKTESFGVWLLDVRRKLVRGEAIDLSARPPEVKWVQLDGTANDRLRQIAAGSIRTPDRDGTVLIIGDSRRPQTHRELASQIPGAVTVEAVDLRDLVEFARTLDFGRPDALHRVVTFAGSVMVNVGAPNLLNRVSVLRRGTARKEPTETEQAALHFLAKPSPDSAVGLLSAIGKEGGVRQHRPAVLRACLRALNACDGAEGNSFYESAIRAREQSRLLGRPLDRRVVSSTLLLKGLEADVAVILDADDLDARNLYVAMTRGAKRLIVCSRSPTLNG